MGSIPLAANNLRVPEQQPNALEQYARIMQMQQQQKMMPGQLQQQQQQIQATGQENQQRQQSIDDQKASTAAMHDWDGKDINQLPALMVKHGASATAVIGMKKNILTNQEQYSTIAKNDSETGAKNLDTLIKKNDMMRGAINTAMDVPDDQLAQHVQEVGQQLVQQGLLDPQHAQAVMGIVQTGDPQKIRQGLKIFSKGYMSESQQLAKAKDDAETAKNNAQAGKDTAETKVINQYGGMGVENRELADYLQKNPGKGPMDFAAAKAKLAPQAQLIVANSQGGGLKDAALDNAAEQYWATGKLPAGGRGPAVMAQNQKIMNRAAEIHSGESITEGSAAFAANKRSLESLQKNFDQVTAFENTAGKNLDVFLGQAKKVIDSGNPLINRPLRTIVGSMGGADQAAFDAARTTALTEISKVLNSSNASGVLSDSARHEVEGLIKPNATLQQIVSAANILKQDMGNRHEAYQSQIDDIRGRMKGGNKSSPQVPASAPAKTLSMSQIQQAAKDHGVSVDEAKKQAQAAGYTIQ
jgi:hypothetical protein